MASFLDYLMSNKPQNTALPPLRIHSEIDELQYESEQYFIIPSGAVAANSNQLAVLIKQPFNLKNSAHIDYISRCTRHYANKAQALYDLDHKIILSLLVAVVAYNLSFLPIIGWLTIAGMLAALYFSTQRSALYQEQQESLKLLTGVCNWSIGPGSDQTIEIESKMVDLRKNTSDELLKNKEILNMREQLSILDDMQTAHFIADDLEQPILDLLAAHDKSFTFFGQRNDAALAARAQIPEAEQIALRRRGAEFKRCVYGLNKGTQKDFIDAFLSALPDLWQAMKSTWKACVTPAPQAPSRP